MEHRTLEQISKVAHVTPPGRVSRWALRRQRLERMADLLDGYQGKIRLLSRIEYLPRSQWMTLREDESPLTVAFRDETFRLQGLKGDQISHAMDFFDLSSREVHDIFCDCHYTGMVTPEKVAQRVRTVAHTMTFREMLEKAGGAIAARWHRMAAAF